TSIPKRMQANLASRAQFGHQQAPIDARVHTRPATFTQPSVDGCPIASGANGWCQIERVGPPRHLLNSQSGGPRDLDCLLERLEACCEVAQMGRLLRDPHATQVGCLRGDSLADL